MTRFYDGRFTWESGRPSKVPGQATRVPSLPVAGGLDPSIVRSWISQIDDAVFPGRVFGGAFDMVSAAPKIEIARFEFSERLEACQLH